MERQIFEALDASFLKDIMIDAFEERTKFSYNYLMDPFSIFSSINLNKSYKPGQDPYKY